MSKGELGKSVAIRLIAAVVFGAIGYFAIYYALQMVAIFGEGMGVDARSREIYASSHMIVHLFAAACALAIGIFYYSRGWVLFTFALAAIVLCGGYGIINMIGFTSTNRVSVAAHKEAKNQAGERHYQAARADLQKQIDWAEKTAAEEVGKERRRLLAYVDTKRKELSALKPPVPGADTVLVDAQASTLGELTGTDPRKWLLALPVPLAILLFFAESFSFVVVGHMLSGIVALFVVFAASSRAAGTSGGTYGGGSGSETPRLTVVPKTEPESTAIRAVAGTSSLSATTTEAEAVGTSSTEPIVVPSETRMFQAQVAWPSHGTSSVDDADDRVSNGGKRVKAAAPKRKRKAKLPFDQMRRAVRASLVHGERTRTIRDIGDETGWSHTHVLRQIEREEGIQKRKQQHLPVRRDPRGLGASLH